VKKMTFVLNYVTSKLSNWKR